MLAGDIVLHRRRFRGRGADEAQGRVRAGIRQFTFERDESAPENVGLGGIQVRHQAIQSIATTAIEIDLDGSRF